MAHPTESDPISFDHQADSPRGGETAFGMKRQAFVERSDQDGGWADALDDFDLCDAASGSAPPASVPAPGAAPQPAAPPAPSGTIAPEEAAGVQAASVDAPATTVSTRRPAGPVAKCSRETRARRGGLLGFLARLFGR